MRSLSENEGESSDTEESIRGCRRESSGVRGFEGHPLIMMSMSGDKEGVLWGWGVYQRLKGESLEMRHPFGDEGGVLRRKGCV